MTEWKVKTFTTIFGIRSKPSDNKWRICSIRVYFYIIYREFGILFYSEFCCRTRYEASSDIVTFGAHNQTMKFIFNFATFRTKTKAG